MRTFSWRDPKGELAAYYEALAPVTVHKVVTVAAAPEAAFRRFTDELGTWWPTGPPTPNSSGPNPTWSTST